MSLYTFSWSIWPTLTTRSCVKVALSPPLLLHLVLSSEDSSRSILMAGRHVSSTLKLGGKALQEIKRWPEQQVADEKEQKKKRRWLAVFDLEPLARCVFYCLIIIAALLVARIYWSRQAACLLNAYEAETSCSSAVTSLWSPQWFLSPQAEHSIPGVCRTDSRLDKPLDLNLTSWEREATFAYQD